MGCSSIRLLPLALALVAALSFGCSGSNDDGEGGSAGDGGSAGTGSGGFGGSGGTAGTGGTPPPAAMLYWGESFCNNSGQLSRSAASGGPVDSVVTFVTRDSLRDIVVNEPGDEIWWVLGGNYGNDDDRIMKARFDGTEVESIIVRTNVEPLPESLQVDFNDEKIYWLNHETIDRANLDGSPSEPIVTLEQGDNRNVAEVALDAQGERIYWADRQFTPLIERSDLNGNNRETVIELPDGEGGAQAITLDLVNDHVYWLEGAGSIPCSGDGCPRIRRAELDGSNPATVLDLDTGTGDDFARSVAVDPVEGKIYWSQSEFCPSGNGTGRIFRADLDGTGVETVQEGLGIVLTIEVVPGG
jgi:hypothetical protein